MTFRQQVYLRLVITFAAAAALTGFALNMAVSAQNPDSDQPVFVLTDEIFYAVYPFADRYVELDIPGKKWNMVLSPDGKSLLIDSQPDDALPSRNFYIVDVATLDVRQLPLAGAGAEVNSFPVWRWDSGALLYVEYDEDRTARVVEYTLANDERIVRVADLTSETNTRESGVPLVVFWSPEAFALLQYNRDITTRLLRYDSNGTILPTITLVDPDDPKNNLYFDNVVHVAGENGDLLALRRPGIEQWDVIDVLSGQITRLDKGVHVVMSPTGLSNPHFVRTLDEAVLFPGIYNLAVPANGQRSLFLSAPKSALTVSPSGTYYAVIDADGFAVSDGNVRIPVPLPPDDQMLRWRVAWAPLEGRIEAIGRLRLDGAAGRFEQRREGLLVLLDTPIGELPVATAYDVRLAPDGESIVWVSRGVNNEAQVVHYDWRTHETNYLFSGAYTEAMPPLPVIVDYDGEIVTLDGEEGRFTLDLDGTLTRED